MGDSGHDTSASSDTLTLYVYSTIPRTPPTNKSGSSRSLRSLSSAARSNNNSDGQFSTQLNGTTKLSDDKQSVSRLDSDFLGGSACAEDFAQFHKTTLSFTNTSVATEDENGSVFTQF